MLKQVGELIRRQHYVQALAVIRLVAGLVAGIGLVVAIVVLEPSVAAGWPIIILALLTAVNLVMVWQSSRQRIDRWLVPVALLDTVLILTLVEITGGIASPLVLLLLFPIGQVAISASPLAAYWVAGFSALAYSSLLFRPLGLTAGTLRVMPGLAHLTLFNVFVSDVCFIAFAIAAGQTGQALRHQEGRLLHRSSRLRREVHTLARLARTTARETEIALILNDVLETAAVELGVERVAVIASDAVTGELSTLSTRGFQRGQDGELEWEGLAAIVRGPLVETVLQRRRTVTAQREYRRPRATAMASPDAAPGAAAAALLVGESCLGCLYVDAGSRSYRWSDESLLLLEAFADLTAVSLDNTRLYSGLLGEKSKLEATMGAVTDALLIYEPSGQVLLANAPFRAILDVSPYATDLTVPGLCTYIAERQRLGLAGWLEQASDLFEVSAVELEVGMPPRALQRRGKVVYDENGQVLATVLTFHDVTEERQAERLREEILATVSHELRTPLTSIKGFMQIFDRRQQKGEAVAIGHELQLVLHQVDRLMALVDDLLDVSNLPGRHVRLERTDVCLPDLARERVAQVTRDSGRSISLDVQATQVCGFWDRRKIGQVLDNLLTNAVKYSDVNSHISVILGNRFGLVQLTVRDEGVGVAPEHLDHLFDAFFRVDNTTTRHTSGLGIGLYLCKRIIEEHGGQMYVRSEPGIGSEFGFTLPTVRQWATRSAHPVAVGSDEWLPAISE